MCIFSKRRDSGFNSFPTPFKERTTHNSLPWLFYWRQERFCPSSHLTADPPAAVTPGPFPADAFDDICSQPMASPSAAGWDGCCSSQGWRGRLGNTQLTNLTPEHRPCTWGGSGTWSSGRICPFSEPQQCERRRRMWELLDPTSSSDLHLLMWQIILQNWFIYKHLKCARKKADLFPRVKHLVQQLFIPHKLNALLLNTYFHQAESINLT